MEAYLDNAATTQCDARVAETVVRVMTEIYGNPSSMHRKGFEAEQYVRNARTTFAKLLKAQEKELFFTSGGTESNNIAVIGAALANQRAGKRILTSSVEHPSVSQTMDALEGMGFEIVRLPVNEQGMVTPQVFRDAMTKDTILASIMMVNNEIGSVQPVQELGAICKECQPACVFHVDAVQGFGKFRIAPKAMNIDLLSASGHKIHGPKGVGLLYVKERTKLRPIVFGGGQQGGLRPGTENVPGIAGMALAAELAYDQLEDKQQAMYRLRDEFAKQLSALPGVRVHSPGGREGAAHIVSAGFSGIRSEVLLHALEERGIYVSSGSACASNKRGISDTLKSIGLSKEFLDSTLRFSFGVYTTEEQLHYCVEVLSEILPRLSRYARR